jgi:hypothetical protein
VSLTNKELWTAILSMVLGAIRVHILHHEVLEGEGPDP